MVGEVLEPLVQLPLFAGEVFGHFDMDGHMEITPTAAGGLTFAAKSESFALLDARRNFQLELVAELGPKLDFITENRLRHGNRELHLHLSKGRLKEVFKN